MTPGDGALALSAYKRSVIYIGMAFSDTRSTMLMKRLEKAIWRCMSDDTDPLCEPRLMAAVLGAAQDAKLVNGKKRKADKDHKGIEQNPRAAPKRRRGAPLDPHDPLGDEGDDDAAGDDELSGDSARGDSF